MMNIKLVTSKEFKYQYYKEHVNAINHLLKLYKDIINTWEERFALRRLIKRRYLAADEGRFYDRSRHYK